MNGLALDITMLAAAGLLLSIGGLALGCAWRERDYRRGRALSVADLIEAPRPQRARKIWDGTTVFDHRDIFERPPS